MAPPFTAVKRGYIAVYMRAVHNWLRRALNIAALNEARKMNKNNNNNNSVIAGSLAEVTVSRIQKPVQHEAWWKALESFPQHHVF